MAVLSLGLSQQRELDRLIERGVSALTFWKGVLGEPPTDRVWNVSRRDDGVVNRYNIHHEKRTLVNRPAPQDFNMF